MLISEAFELYREREVIAAGLSSNTDESYIYAGHHAVDFFDDVDVKTIQISDITKFYEHLMSWLSSHFKRPINVVATNKSCYVTK